MKTEIVIFPNPNQMIVLRKLQRELCGEFGVIPILPLCVKSEKLTDLNPKVTKIEVEGLKEEADDGKNIIFLGVNLEINGETSFGKIEIGMLRLRSATKSVDDTKMSLWGLVVEPCRNMTRQSLSHLSPFRICQLQTEESDNGRTWKITREKWGKVRFP